MRASTISMLLTVFSHFSAIAAGGIIVVGVLGCAAAVASCNRELHVNCHVDSLAIVDNLLAIIAIPFNGIVGRARCHGTGKHYRDGSKIEFRLFHCSEI